MTKKIAIIEDDVAIAQMYRIKFEAEGFVVETAENGVYGLELIQEMQPDMVLLDLMMPEMNGIDLVKEIRRRSDYDDVPLMMVTTETEMERMAAAFVAGANEYLMKPFDREAILEKLQILGVGI